MKVELLRKFWVLSLKVSKRCFGEIRMVDGFLNFFVFSGILGGSFVVVV